MKKAIPTVLALILLLGLGTSSGPATEPHLLQGKKAPVQKTDKENMVGTWRITKGREGGKVLPSEITAIIRLVFTKDGKATLQMPEGGKEGKYQVAAAGQIDIAFGGQAKLSPGIYKFAGPDCLTICVAVAPGGKRPTEFSGDKGLGQVRLDSDCANRGRKSQLPRNSPSTRKGQARSAATARAQHLNNLRQMGIGMHEYHDANGSLPGTPFTVRTARHRCSAGAWHCCHTLAKRRCTSNSSSTNRGTVSTTRN